MGRQRTGSAKKKLPYHNTLILHKSKNLTVKDQLEENFLYWFSSSLVGESLVNFQRKVA
jgi:hypothetical protein